jgi:hypothetical protein
VFEDRKNGGQQDIALNKLIGIKKNREQTDSRYYATLHAMTHQVLVRLNHQKRYILGYDLAKIYMTHPNIWVYKL